MAKHSELLRLTAEYVANEFNIDLSTMFSETRKKNCVEARQLFHYFCFKHLGFTLNQIGEFSQEMGRENPHNHATVLHGYKTISDRKSVDRKFNVYMTTLEDELLDSVMTSQEGIEKRKNEINQITRKAILTHNELIFERVYELITHIIRGDSVKDLDELIKIQVEKNNGRLHQTAQGDNVMGAVSGHKYKVRFHTPTT